MLLTLSSDRVLALAALLPTTFVIAFGSYTSLNNPGNRDAPTATQIEAARASYVLIFADSQKALFRTAQGTMLVTRGSQLATAGRVTEIALRDGRWSVSTDKGYTFNG